MNMFMPVLSGLVVSVDAFFIGVSLGLQKKCKFMYLVLTNACLLGLCIFGFLIAGRIYELVQLEADLVIGLAFITLGLWCILRYYISTRTSKASVSYENKSPDATATSLKTIVIIGLVMSVEAMLITIGITFVFLPGSTIIIPITVAVAHFLYSALSFKLARTKHMKRIPIAVSHIISGIALIIYGLLAIFVEFGV